MVNSEQRSSDRIEPTGDKLEQYLQKIEEGKFDPLVGEIVALQGEYVDQRVNLKNEQAEQIKQLAIQTIKKLSQLDLEKLVHEPHFIASIYQREIDEGMGDYDLIHKRDQRFQKSDNPYLSQEASAKLIFLAYSTKELGDLQEQFLQDYLGSEAGNIGNELITPKREDVKYVVHKENGTVSEEKSFQDANPAFIKFNEQYKQAWERAQKLRDSSYEFKSLIVDPDNKKSPVRDKASEMGAFYGTWGNGIQSYFKTNPDGTMHIPCGREDRTPFLYRESFGTNPEYLYSVKNVDEQRVVHLDRSKAN